MLDPSTYSNHGLGSGSGSDSEEIGGPHIRRKEQDLVDDIIAGRKPGQYFLIMGPKVCFISCLKVDRESMERNLD